MLAQLDPYTRYFPETKMEDVRFMQTGEYGGVGASIETRNGQTIVVDLLEGEPAEQAGLQLGDVVMRVNGRDLAGLDHLEHEGCLKGGMRPKAAAIRRALTGGVARVHVLDGAMPQALLREVFTTDGAGTLVVVNERAAAPEASLPGVHQADSR